MTGRFPGSRNRLSRIVVWTLLTLGVTVPGAEARVPQVQHVIIVFQENRTPDNLFCGFKSRMPAADLACSGLNSRNEQVALTAIPLAGTYDPDHSYTSFMLMYNGGQMNGADQIKCKPNAGYTCPPNANYRYIRTSDVRPYFDIARIYGFANRMFQSNKGSSFPAHQFIIAGTSAPDPTTTEFAAGEPGPTRNPTGCLSVSSTSVALVGPDGLADSRTYPCFEHGTLMDLLDSPPGGAAPISWRYYAINAGSPWTGPNAIEHICQPRLNPATSTMECTGPSWTGNVVTDPTRVLTDIQAGALPAVSWVMPKGGASDHAGSGAGNGPSWVASIVNAVGNDARYWPNTVILITWDDWGGWYDHVVPPADSAYGYFQSGFRVPLLVVSAYTPYGYVSNVSHNFGSIIRFVEWVFDLPFIPPGTFDDARADDLHDFFRFGRAPRTFIPIQAPISARTFIQDKRPSLDMD